MQKNLFWKPYINATFSNTQKKNQNHFHFHPREPLLWNNTCQSCIASSNKVRLGCHLQQKDSHYSSHYKPRNPPISLSPKYFKTAQPLICFRPPPAAAWEERSCKFLAAAAEMGSNRSANQNRYWTEEKHVQFLNSMEASFVREMFENNDSYLLPRLDRYLPDTSDSTLDLKKTHRRFSTAGINNLTCPNLYF